MYNKDQKVRFMETGSNVVQTTMTRIFNLAEMLETDLEKLSAQLWTNSCKVFNLPEE